jgi:hypothetical protein
MFNFAEIPEMIYSQFILAFEHLALGVLNTTLPGHKDWGCVSHRVC